MKIQAYAAHEPSGKLESFEYELGSLKPDEVEIDVEYCGVCHSDLSMLKNEWGFTRYPFVPGHEVIGKVAAIGNMVNHLELGQYVGLGWRARSCLGGSVGKYCVARLKLLLNTIITSIGNINVTGRIFRFITWAIEHIL